MKASSENRALSSRQVFFIPYLISSSSIEAACRRARVSKPTVYAWLKDKRFTEELQRQRQQVYNESLEVLKTGHKKAVDKLLELVNSKKDDIALRACAQIISHSLKVNDPIRLTNKPSVNTPFSAENIHKAWQRIKLQRALQDAEQKL